MEANDARQETPALIPPPARQVVFSCVRARPDTLRWIAQSLVRWFAVARTLSVGGARLDRDGYCVI